MKAMGKVTLTLGLMIIVSLFLTSCSGVVTPELQLDLGEDINTVTPEIASGNLENQEDIYQSSNNSQNSSTGPIYEPVTEEPVTEEPVTEEPVTEEPVTEEPVTEEPVTEEPVTEEPVTEEPVTEEPVTEEPVTVYPQKWATGDGTVENPWANDCIQKAYDFVPDDGTIFLKAGYYKLSAQIEINKKVDIIGEGRNITIIKTANARGFQINADYCVLRNLTVDGDAQTDGSHQCINITQANYLLLENVDIKNAGYYGLNMNDVNHCTFRNIYAHDNYRHGVHSGANMADTNQNNVYKNIYCWNNGVNGFDDRGSYDSSDNIYDGIHCWNNGDHGTAICSQDGGNLINSLVYDNGYHGMYISGVHNFIIENCNARSNYRDGIYLRSGNNINLSNVITKNNSTSNTGNDCGIHIYDIGSTKLSLCQSYDDRETQLQDAGIRTEGTTKYVEITDCKLMPNEKYAILNHAGAVIIEEIKLARF